MMKNKTAIITGSAKRIGRGVALDLAKNGYDIALTYNKSLQEAKQLQNEIKEKYCVQCEIFICDFFDEAQYNKLFSKIASKMQDISILINNASIFEKSDFMDHNEDFERNLSVHLKAPMALIKNFAKYCQQYNINNTNIINMLDKNITRHSTNFFYYLFSKKMLCELTRMLAVELGPEIRVNAIAPGYILDDHFIEDSKSLQDKIIAKTPLLRKGSVENIVKTVDFIVNNNYVTGQVLFIDGGSGLDLTNN